MRNRPNSELKNGILEQEDERRLAEILGVIEQDLKYIVDKGPLKNHDLSKVYGDYFDIRLRRKNVEVIKVRTHYGGEMKRIAVFYDPYNHALESYNHPIEELDKFLKENDYEMRKHITEIKKKEEDKKKEKKK